ncbi:hypothetical protein [Actinophytocola sp.]|uniref:hypothetical protein n=1 Tax=Actinophytocola sp. TaxID=1872138 RepID=UPI002D7EFFA1|nr:hypothetical protein [Actinophytocola sp.]HET9143512.1 hypothetical protein [Actinophytocola sp.]
MDGFSITEDELRDLKTKLTDLQLSDDQRKVLNAMIKLAGDVVDGEPDEAAESAGPSLAGAVASAFTPAQAGLLVAYAAAPGPYHPLGISKSHPSGSAITAMITR